MKRTTSQGYRVSEAARNLGIHATQLRRWVKGESHETSPAMTSMVQLQAELKQLKRERECLRMEREILKKASAFFAKELV